MTSKSQRNSGNLSVSVFIAPESHHQLRYLVTQRLEMNNFQGLLLATLLICLVNHLASVNGSRSCASGYGGGDDTKALASGANDMVVVKQTGDDGTALKSTKITVQVNVFF